MRWGLLRQSVFGRLAGYEDVNDEQRWQRSRPAQNPRGGAPKGNRNGKYRHGTRTRRPPNYGSSSNRCSEDRRIRPPHRGCLFGLANHQECVQ